MTTIAPTLVFPSEPFDVEQVNSVFEAEMAVAKELGFPIALVDDSNLEDSVDNLKFEFSGEAIYRGWILGTQDYITLYDGLLKKGLKLVNNPLSYYRAQNIPEYYHVIAEHTPRTVWSKCGSCPSKDTLNSLWGRLDSSTGAVLKDFVKSESAYWAEACFVPDAETLPKVVNRFLELRGTLYTGGLVLREFVPNIEGEVRTFWHDQRLVHSTHPDLIFKHPLPEWLKKCALNLKSRFVTIDLILAKGNWQILEVGDGQVSGIKDSGASHMYSILYEQYEAFQFSQTVGSKEPLFVEQWFQDNLQKGRFGLCNQALQYLSQSDVSDVLVHTILRATPESLSERNRFIA